MNRGTIELEVGDVSNMEARVVVRFLGVVDEPTQLDPPIQFRGSLRGPYCAAAHTLPAEYPFRALAGPESAAAEAIVTDPCWWSAELPHLYEANVEALRGEEIVAEYHGKLGLRSSGPMKTWE
jgi:hypothetical protein